MGHDAHSDPSISPVSRRAVIGGLAAGAGALGLALAARPAGATTGRNDDAPAAMPFGAERAAATARRPELTYVVYSGFQIEPLSSGQVWSRGGGYFAFTDHLLAGYCQPSIELPLGSVLREVEIYGFNRPGARAKLEFWRTTHASPTTTATRIVADDVVFPTAPGPFTVTKDVEITWNDETQTIPFIYVTDTADNGTAIAGVRIGYEAVVQTPAFVPISPIPRPYNTRDTAGLTKLNPGEERTITLPVPAGISAAVIQLTVTETGAGGFVGVFPADAASWPGNSSINWSSANENVGGTVITAVSADGKIKLRGGGSPTHVIVDVPGYLS